MSVHALVMIALPIAPAPFANAAKIGGHLGKPGRETRVPACGEGGSWIAGAGSSA